MKRKTETVWIVLMLGLSLMSTYGFAEEPRTGRMEAELSPQTRAALAADIQRREQEGPGKLGRSPRPAAPSVLS